MTIQTDVNMQRDKKIDTTSGGKKNPKKQWFVIIKLRGFTQSVIRHRHLIYIKQYIYIYASA